MIIGLPLHLTMTIIGTGTQFTFIPRFLYVLCYPFFTDRTYQTTPFTSITIFISDKLTKPWQNKVSDINGYYGLTSPLPENILLDLFCQNRTWKNVLFKGSLLPKGCLFPIPKSSLNAKEKVMKTIYDLRIIPLVLACVTSITAFFIRPNYFILIYIYFSLQYTFSEYLYPRFK